MNNPFLLATKKLTPLAKRLTPLANKLAPITEKLTLLKENLTPVVKKITPAWRLLYKPILVVSVGIHALVLILPTPPEPKANPTPTPSPVKREKVKITSLKGAASKTPPKRAAAAAKPKLKQPPKPVVSNPRNAPPPIPKPEEEKPKEEKPKEEKPKEEKPEEKPKVEETPKEEKPPEEKQEEETPPEEKQEEETPPEEKQEEKTPEPTTPANENSTDPNGSGKGLLKELRDRVRRDLLNSGTNDPAVVDQTLDSFFPEEDFDRSFFFDGQALKAGNNGSMGISQFNPRNAYSEYIEKILTEELEFEVEEISEGYGGEKLYKAKNDGGVEFYMSLIKIGFSNTLVILWEKDPNSL